MTRHMEAKKRKNGKTKLGLDNKLAQTGLLSRENMAEDIERALTVARVRDMLHLLPLAEQEAVILSLEGLSRREAAVELGITSGQYQGRLARGMLLMRGMTDLPAEPIRSKTTCRGAVRLTEGELEHSQGVA